MSAITEDTLSILRIEPQNNALTSSKGNVIEECVTINDNRSHSVCDSVLYNGVSISEGSNIVAKVSSLEMDVLMNYVKLPEDLNIISHESPRRSVILTNENPYEEINLISGSPQENLATATEDETLKQSAEDTESPEVLLNNISDVDSADAKIYAVPLAQDKIYPECNSVSDSPRDNLEQREDKASDDPAKVNSENIIDRQNTLNGVNEIDSVELQTAIIQHEQSNDDIYSKTSKSINSEISIDIPIITTSVMSKNAHKDEPVVFMKPQDERNFDSPGTFGNSLDLAASAERSWKSMETFHSHENDDDNDDDDNVVAVRAEGTPTRHSIHGSAWSPSLHNTGNLIRGSASFSYYNPRGYPSLSTATVSPSFSTGRAGNISDTELGMSAIDMDNAGFEEINLQSNNTNENTDGGGVSSPQNVENVQQLTPQPSGLVRFFRRSLFSKNPAVVIPPVAVALAKETEDTSKKNVPGWQFFANGTTIQPPQVFAEHQDPDHSITSQPSKMLGSSVKMRTNKEAPSTTALILHRRPSELPAKDPLEESHHQQLNEEMIETARKIEKKDKKLREKRRLQQIREEEQLSAAVRTWKTEILPSWHIERHSRRTRELWWNGIPSCVRGKVWKLAIGNDLNVTSELYEICTQRAKEKLRCLREPKSDVNAGGSDNDSISSITEFVNRESSVELIAMDVSRTFPQLCIFQKKGPYHNQLKGLLGAYACYRPDVGYVQGMSFLAAVLLLNMEVIDTFICFANLLNKPSNVAFFNLDQVMMKAYFDTYREFFKENLPRLFAHFEVLQMNPDLYIIDWMYTMFAKSLPLDVTSRVWDVFFRDGEEFLFRTALGILCMYEDILLRLDFIHVAQFLTRLPEDLSGDELFRCIGLIHMLHEKQVFELVLARNQERCAAQAAAFALTQTLSPPPT